MSVNVIVIIHAILAIFLTITVLLQPGKGGGFIMGGGTSQSLFGTTGASNFLTKLTGILAILLVISAITLTRIQRSSSKKSVFDDFTPEASSEAMPKKPKAKVKVKAEGKAGKKKAPSKQ